MAITVIMGSIVSCLQNIIGIIRFVVVPAWLILLSKRHLRFIHIVLHLDSSLFIAEIINCARKIISHHTTKTHC